jgi:hypothetical protein
MLIAELTMCSLRNSFRRDFHHNLFFAAAVMACLQSIPKAAAQQQPTSEATPLANPTKGANLTDFFSGKTPYEFWLTCLLGIVGIIIIVLLIVALRSIPRRRPEDVTRPIIVVTIVFGTLILVTAGYSNQQIAPAFGLLGTIVGYILGRGSASQPASGPPTEPPPPTTQTPPRASNEIDQGSESKHGTGPDATSRT